MEHNYPSTTDTGNGGEVDSVSQFGKGFHRK